MFSVNPRQDQFQLIIPKEFHIQKLVDKYDKFINLKPHVLKSITEILQETIQNVTFPGAERMTVTQSISNLPRVIETQHASTEDMQMLIKDKTVTVEFRHVNGYLNYWYMRELFTERFAILDKRQYIPNMLLNIMDDNRHIMFTICMSKLLFKSISDLPLSYNITSRDFHTFSCVFTYNSFEPMFDLPTTKLTI